MSAFRGAAAAALAFASAGALASGDTVPIPPGKWEPLFTVSDADILSRGLDTDQRVDVPAFSMDRHLVTNLEFHRFTREHPRWKPSRVASLFADHNYLSHWYGDDLDATSPAHSPVVNVSWFAAKGYCESRGMELPTVAQWEYVASASATSRDATDDIGFLKQVTAWYQQPPMDPPSLVTEGAANAYGVVGMHQEVWEWVLDFNTALVTGDARGDTDVDRQLFCAGGSVGASDFKNYPAFLRFALRGSVDGSYTHSTMGFRCVQNASQA